MKVALGCDHAGINLKPALIKYLNGENVDFKDFGTYSADSVDYNDYAVAVSKAVLSGEYDFGILICGTGIGMSIVANKFKGIRCAHCSDAYSARLTREHNDANVLAIGERVVGAGVMEDIVAAFLKTPFSGGERHSRRVEKIKAIEDENFK